jgi:hypothetical protein
MLKAILLPLTALALVVCCFSASASAGLVPPGNSAANQYTETFPTTKGEEDEEGRKKRGVTPAQVLGAGKAHQLEDKGPTGRAVANFAAETSPTADGSAAGGSGNGKPDKSKGEKNGAGGPNGGDEGGPGGGGGAGGGQAPSGGTGAAAASSGSSGIGEIASQATGTSSGTVGLWLPLILIAVVIWSAAYVWRNRQQRVV